jgi:transposase InsO family protein
MNCGSLVPVSRLRPADNGGPWKGLEDLEIATATWVSWFKEERPHSWLDDQTPAEFEAEHYAHKSQPTAP